jgi:MFS family permease
MKMIDQYKGLPREVYVILVARIISALGMFVYPFLTLFLSNRVGFSEAKIGIFMLVISLSYIPAAMIGGKLADHFNRKYTFLVSMVFSDIALIAAGFLSDSFAVVYLIIISFFFLNMSMPVLAAMMMDITAPANRQESFSLTYLGINIGGAIGPMIAGLLFVSHTAWIFYGEALLNLVALALIFLFIQDTKPSQEALAAIATDASRSNEAASNETLFRVLLRNPLLLGFAACASILAFGYSQVSFMLPLQMEDIFGISDGARYFGMLFSFNCIVVVIATPFLVLLTKNRNPIANMAVSGILFMFGFGLYGSTEKLGLFAFFVVIWTCGEIVSFTNTGVYIANHSPVTHRARFQSIFDIIQGLGRAIGPLVIGYYLIAHSIPEGWILVAILCLFASFALYGLYLFERRQKRR